MIRYIRRAAAFCLLLLVALLANAARVQVFEAGALDDNPANRRTTIARYSQPRGDIVVGDEPVTGSKDTHEQLAYERTYRHGPLYAPVTGYASQTYGTTLLENAEDPVLSGTASVLAPLPCGTTSPATGSPAATSSPPSGTRCSGPGTRDWPAGVARSPCSIRPPARSWRWSPPRRTTPSGSPARAPR